MRKWHPTLDMSPDQLHDSAMEIMEVMLREPPEGSLAYGGWLQERDALRIKYPAILIEDMAYGVLS